ncbi:hypothetical protein GCM10028775_48230 [Catellatospora paridis]
MAAQAGNGRATQSKALPIELATQAEIIAPAESTRPSSFGVRGDGRETLGR